MIIGLLAVATAPAQAQWAPAPPPARPGILAAAPTPVPARAVGSGAAIPARPPATRFEQAEPTLPWPRSGLTSAKVVETAPERGIFPPGLLRYRIPAPMQPYAAPYAVAGAALLASDAYVLRGLRLDSLHVRTDGPGGAARGVFRGLSRLGDPPVVAGLLAGLYALGGSGERDAARVGAVAYGNAITLTYAVKALTGKERPRDSSGRPRYQGPTWQNAAFPSAHTSGTAAVAHVMAHYYPSASGAFYGASGLVGVARMGLGRHWPSDVWWGWGAGVMAAEGALHERERIEAWRPW